MANPNDLNSFCSDKGTSYCNPKYHQKCPGTCPYAIKVKRKIELLAKKRQPAEELELEQLITSTSLML